MMNYQEFKEKLKMMESSKLEKMRLTSILAIVLVFGVFLYQYSFAPQSAKGEVVGEQSVSSAKASAIYVVGDDKNLPVKNAVSSTTDDTIMDQGKTVSTSTESVSDKKDVKDSIASSDDNPNFLPIRDYGVKQEDVNAKAAIVMTEDDKIIFQKNIDDKLPMASLTKVMVGLVVLENIPDDEVITITQDALNTYGTAGHFRAGDKFLSKDLLTIMLLVSSNDAAVAFQGHFASKGMDMIRLMNAKAEELGLLNTHFTNPVGFDDKEHYSTARDYAELVKYSLSNKELWGILSTKNELISSLDPNESPKDAVSSNRLMFNSNLWGIIGGKTGYTDGAGGCLMTVFEGKGQNGRENEKLISVVLGASDVQTRFSETEKLINWVRKAYIF